MNFGVVFPQTEFGSDPIAVRDYAQAVEGLGYTHIVAYDHVLGANPERPGGWTGRYTHEAAFLEPFVLFSYMAAVTQRVGFAPGIIILPQRQTALVAKQAATLDVLSAGRLRLGVGLGWNEIEYIALGEDFHTRGRRIEEQVALLRELWTKPLVTFAGNWHTVPDAGLNPLPVQRPIPIWFGANDERALERAARLGDGWMVNLRTPEEARQPMDKVRRYLDQAGRNPQHFGVEARIIYGEGDPSAWSRLLEGWKSLDVGWISLNTMGSGLKTPSAHIAAVRAFAQAMGPLRI
jgi:probable F420-dependent oxidoreductase